MEKNTKTKSAIEAGVDTRFRKLCKIADWQLDAKDKDVDLPALQRGYVWKPKQVEKLWDSLLRGFPIGSFLVSQKNDSESTKDLYLLDGQQRATAIAMGYYNPWNESQNPNFFSSKFKKDTIEKTVPILWLDIGTKDNEQKGENNDFIFLPRIVTQSHPWGYTKNGDTISLKIRRQAIEEFSKLEGKYTEYNLKDVYPWDATLPVPLAFLIQAFTNDELVFEEKKETLIENCKKLKYIVLKDGTPYIEKVKDMLNQDGFLKKMQSAFKIINTTYIPIITLKDGQLSKQADNIEDASTLFVRINTAGTPLQGEELIYSMYKTAFPQSKDIVESAGAGFIAPSRIISHISRIVSTDIAFEKNTNQALSIPQPLKLKQFQQNIKEDGFKKNLNVFVEETNPKNVENLFKNVKEIFEGNNDFKFPLPLVVDIARDKNPDPLFALLYWLHKTDLTIEEILQDYNLHKKILATVTILTWFSIDTNSTKGTKIALDEFATYDSFRKGNKNFWGNVNFNNPTLRKSIVNLFKPEHLKDKLIFGKAWEILEKAERELFEHFKWKLFNQRGLLLFVQREYINKKFDQLQWDVLLEDSNRPYDWDHIYPSIKNQHNTYQEIRELNNTIGNYRVLALEDNRSDGAKLPKDKLNSYQVQKDSFVDVEDWKDIGKERITTDEAKAKQVCNAIYTRIGNIYEEWYNTLSVGELFE